MSMMRPWSPVSFRKSLFKTFNKTLEEGLFPMLIVDAVNHKVSELSLSVHFTYGILYNMVVFLIVDVSF